MRLIMIAPENEKDFSYLLEGDVEKYKARGETLIGCISEEDAILGIMSAELGEREIDIHYVCVDSRQRGLGIGSYMLSYFTNRVDQGEMDTVRLFYNLEYEQNVLADLILYRKDFEIEIQQNDMYLISADELWTSKAIMETHYPLKPGEKLCTLEKASPKLQHQLGDYLNKNANHVPRNLFGTVFHRESSILYSTDETLQGMLLIHKEEHNYYIDYCFVLSENPTLILSMIQKAALEIKKEIQDRKDVEIAFFSGKKSIHHIVQKLTKAVTEKVYLHIAEYNG